VRVRTRLSAVEQLRQAYERGAPCVRDKQAGTKCVCAPTSGGTFSWSSRWPKDVPEFTLLSSIAKHLAFDNTTTYTRSMNKPLVEQMKQMAQRFNISFITASMADQKKRHNLLPSTALNLTFCNFLTTILGCRIQLSINEKHVKYF
jgi:hypothetical protein